MNLRSILLIGIFAFVFAMACLAQPLFPNQYMTNRNPDAVIAVLTNAAAANALSNALPTLPPGVEQIIDALGPKAKAIAIQIFVWIGVLSAAFASLGNWLNHKIRDIFNAKAEASSLSDDDWLAKTFSNPIYAVIAWLLRIVSINLPTTSDLTRAIELQKEAVLKAHLIAESKPTPPQV